MEFNDSFELKKNEFLNEFSSSLTQEVNQIVQDLKLNSRSFFWLEQMQNLSELKQMIEECEENQDDNGEDELTEYQDVIFSVLSESEYAQFFLEKNETLQSIKQAAIETVILIEEKLLNFSKLYFQNSKTIGFYENIFEFAEFDKKSIGPRDPDHLFIKEGIRFFTFDQKNIKMHISNIERALNTIQIATPKSYERLCLFTKTIIPLKEESMVSYSEQSIPGHSIINLYNRDRIDLLDDLLHENGHHHMNHFLNSGDLIVEDDEKNYFSPWRNTMRPLRGIYHAVFTFYWALELFYDLIHWNQFEEEFSIDEQKKIINRFLEEYVMLSFCQKALEQAYDEGKILEFGKAIIDETYELIDLKHKTFERLKDKTTQNLIDKLSSKVH